ncbi:uncharacterized protein LOC117653663 [Thrips palmi]|uniref:Uncharacterized protein LOC117653663 n=1 Tax=Thrips palmi TaxID=161013 RepID=A0A6P9ACY8_THRPL|nr:uncharacterized protein LOC117653663 [Thrips palmi]
MHTKSEMSPFASISVHKNPFGPWLDLCGRRMDANPGPQRTHHGRSRTPTDAILHRLPHLTVLDIDEEMSDDFLDALDGKVVPGLEKLFARLPPNAYCEHAELHIEEDRMRHVMRRYPRLHVMFKEVQRNKCSGCGFCTSNPCHADLDPYGAPCALHSHQGRCNVVLVYHEKDPDPPRADDIFVDTTIFPEKVDPIIRFIPF